MRRQLIFLLIIAIVSLLMGCKPQLIIKDALPAEIAKGYIEFYCLKSMGIPPVEAIIQRVDNKRRIFEGIFSPVWHSGEKVGLRLAQIPGNYSYIVRVGTAEVIANLKIYEGMITPIRIQFDRSPGTKARTRRPIQAVNLQSTEGQYELIGVTIELTVENPFALNASSIKTTQYQADLAIKDRIVSVKNRIEQAEGRWQLWYKHSKDIDAANPSPQKAQVAIRDNKTGLLWKAGPDKNTTWQQAEKWVESLNTKIDVWRMPGPDELAELYIEGYGSRNLTPLLPTTGWWVWSNESIDETNAKGFDFNTGSVFFRYRYHAYGMRAFAVRSLLN